MLTRSNSLSGKTYHPLLNRGCGLTHPSASGWLANLGLALFATALAIPSAGLAPSIVALLFAGVMALQVSPVKPIHDAGPISVVIFVAIYLAGLFWFAPESKAWLLAAPMTLGLAAYLLMLRIADAPGNRLLGWGLFLGVAIQAIAVTVISFGGQLPIEILAQINLPMLIVPNDLAIVAILLALGRSLVPDRRFSNLMWALGALLAAAAVVLETRTTLLVLAVALGIGEHRSGLAVSRRFMLWLLLSTAVVIMLWLTDFRLVAKTIGGLHARAELWSLAVDRIAERPWLGWGPYELEFSGLVNDPRHMAWPHNLLLETWASLGLLGFAALLASLAVHWHRLLTKLQEPRRQHLIAAGAGMAIFALLEASWMRVGFIVSYVLWLALIGPSNKNTSC